MKANCARILIARGRLITFASGAGIHSGKMDMVVRCLMIGNSILGARSGLVFGFWYLFENGKS